MTLVFLHLERTGGTTLYHLLAGAFPSEAIRPVPFGRALRELPEGFPAANYGDTVEYHLHFAYQGCDVVMGHYDWAVVERVENPQVIFLMREPVARVISLFKLFHKPERLAWCQVSQRVAGMTLDQFIDDPDLRPLTSDAGTRILLGRRWSCPDVAPIDDDLALAVERLNRAFFVGVTERFAEGMTLLESQIGRSFGAVTIINAGEMAVEVTPAQRRRILEFNRADAVLYQYARERFDYEYQVRHSAPV